MDNVVLEGPLKVRRASAPTTFTNHPAGLGGGTRWCTRHFVLTTTELVQKPNEAHPSAEETYYIPLSTIHAVHASVDASKRTLGSFMSSSVRALLAPVAGAVAGAVSGAVSGATSSGGGTGGGSSSTTGEPNAACMFSLELVGDSQESRPVLVFEADDPGAARSWCNALEARIDTPVETLNLTKEETGRSITDEYDLGVSLGSGMSGVVKKITRKADGKAFAMKTISLQQLTGKQLAALRNEIDILKSLDHPHICKLYGVFTEPGVCVRLVLELCDGGELFDRLHQKKRLDEAWVARLVFRMAGVLRYLHENNIAHRDLKLENWLFRSKKDDDEIVLIDFGLSHRYRPNEHMHKKVGTSYYVAPEVLQGDYVGVQADVWSLGVIVYMLLAGTAPFDGPDDDAILARIATHKPPNYESGAWRRVSSEAKDFVSKLLTVDPSERLTAEKALEHPWVAAQGRVVAAEQHDINDDIYENLHKFAGFSTLKRIAIEAVAFSLAHEEIKSLEATFAAMDSDNNGFVSFSGFKRGLMKHHTVSEEEVYRIWSALDVEKANRLHVREFVAAALQEKYWNDEANLRAAFASLGSSGFITVADLKNLLGKHVTRERALEMIKAAELEDHGDDHKLSWKEFLDFVRRDGDNNVKLVYEGKSPVRAAPLKNFLTGSSSSSSPPHAASSLPGGGGDSGAGSGDHHAATKSHGSKKFSLGGHLL